MMEKDGRGSTATTIVTATDKETETDTVIQQQKTKMTFFE
jgi:hypothetical protein